MNGGLPAEVATRLLHMTPAGLVMMGADRLPRWTNNSAMRVLAREEDDILGRDFLDFFPPRERAPMRERLEAPEGNLPGRWTSRIARPGGEEREVEGIDLHVRHDGEPLVVVALFDVTDFHVLRSRMDALAGFAASLAYAGTLEGTLEGLARSVVRATGAGACSVILFEEDGGVRVAGSAGEAAGEPAVRVPLVFRSQELGRIDAWFTGAMVPGEAERGFMRTLGDLAAVAVVNARLVAEVGEKATLEERARLARELHDSVSQALYGISLGARTARTLLDRDPSKAAEPLDYVLSMTEGALAEMRALIFELRPEFLADEGLVAALDKQVKVLRTRHGLEVEARLGDEPAAPLEVKHALYRIAMETLHNCVRHAAARRVAVVLDREDGCLVLTVEDDGRGFDPAGDFPGHLGLRGMRERAERLGGRLEVVSSPGKGTQIRAAIPA